MQRRAGVPQQVAGRALIAYGDADAGRHRERSVLRLDLEWGPERLHDPSRHQAASRGKVVVLEEDDELVAADAPDGVALAYGIEQPVRGGPEELVPGCMAQGIVHVLEAVDVEEERGPDRAVPTSPGE